jgi:uncharacterized protein
MIIPSKVVIFHGTGGNPEINWLPWLAKELRLRGLTVLVPRFPTPEGQSLRNWSGEFSEQVGSITGDMILVGHSMGCGMVLRLLEHAAVPVTAAFLVAGWTGLLNNPEFDPLTESFFADPFNWPLIRKNAGPVTMYHGDNDPYVPLVLGQELAGNIGAELKIIQNGGHLNAGSGFVKFNMLLTDILNRAVMCGAC